MHLFKVSDEDKPVDKLDYVEFPGEDKPNIQMKTRDRIYRATIGKLNLRYEVYEHVVRHGRHIFFDMLAEVTAPMWYALTGYTLAKLWEYLRITDLIRNIFK